jgi:hypothetical protein
MKRRALLIGSLGSALAGCISTLDSRNGPQSEGKRVEFERTESEYVIEIENSLTKWTEVNVSVTDSNGVVEEETVSVEPADMTAVSGLFRTGAEPYTVSVSVSGVERETVLEPSESPHDKYTYTISSGGIGFEKGYRPAPELVISNHLDRRVDVRVEVENRTEGNKVYDVVTVPPNDINSFRSVFMDTAKYDIAVQSNGMTDSITHRNSETTTVSIRVDHNELGIEQGER